MKASQYLSKQGLPFRLVLSARYVAGLLRSHLRTPTVDVMPRRDDPRTRSVARNNEA